MIQRALKKVLERQDLTRDEAFSTMDWIMDGRATPSQISAFLIAMRMKGEKSQEIAGFATSMRNKACRVNTDGMGNAVDLVGTGGHEFTRPVGCRRLRWCSMLKLTLLTEDAVDGRLGAQVHPPVGQAWHDLLG